MPQREDPMYSAEEVCRALGVPAEGAQVSGGRLHSFREGWAKELGPRTAHYFTRSELDATVVAKCGATAPVARLYGAGNFIRCRHCRKKLGQIKVHR